MQISIITLFPQIFDSVFSYSIIKRAQNSGKITINIVDLRNFGLGRHKTVDDRPYGGGVGMILRVDVVARAIRATSMKGKRQAIVMLDPKGQVFKQKLAETFSKFDHLILLCGHYEGFDERIRGLVDYEISVGDYILSGGEIAAMVVTEATARLVPGVLKSEEASLNESFSKKDEKRLLEHPHYTRPRVFNGKKVPKVLLSGNFPKINEFREKKARELTRKRRPDLE